MRIYKNTNVFDEALARIRWLYDEFEEVVVSYSGGKDSTVVFNLALRVARERGRLPLNVLWIDQEAEWQATVDMVRKVMTHPDVRPYWVQIPMRLFNATSGQKKSQWLMCWDPEEKHRWMRPQEDFAITENVYGTDRFFKLFDAILAKEFKGEKLVNIGGVRAEESPPRLVGLTHYPTYKWATWGKNLAGKNHYTMYPIYDWDYRDVWKAIHDEGWAYNNIYNIQYQYGISVRDMRVSNVHHETAVMHLFYMQEAEPQTYERLTQRIGGIATAGRLSWEDFYVRDLPYMFANWREYRNFLLDKMITNEEFKKKMATTFHRHDTIYAQHFGDSMYRMHVNAILANDWEGVKLKNYETNPKRYRVQQAHVAKYGQNWKT